MPELRGLHPGADSLVGDGDVDTPTAHVASDSDDVGEFVRNFGLDSPAACARLVAAAVEVRPRWARPGGAMLLLRLEPSWVAYWRERAALDVRHHHVPLQVLWFDVRRQALRWREAHEDAAAMEVEFGMDGDRQSEPSSAPVRSSELAGSVSVLSSGRGATARELYQSTASASFSSTSTAGTCSEGDGSDGDGPPGSTPKCLSDEGHHLYLLRSQFRLYHRPWLLRHVSTVRWALGRGTPATSTTRSAWRSVSYWRSRGRRDEFLEARELCFGPVGARPVAFWRRRGWLLPFPVGGLHRRRAERWRRMWEAVRVEGARLARVMPEVERAGWEEGGWIEAAAEQGYGL